MTRQPIACPTFDRIDLVQCEDGETLMAYAYPNRHDDAGMVAINLADLPRQAFPTARHLEAGDDDDDWHAR